MSFFQNLRSRYGWRARLRRRLDCGFLYSSADYQLRCYRAPRWPLVLLQLAILSATLALLAQDKRLAEAILRAFVWMQFSEVFVIEPPSPEFLLWPARGLLAILALTQLGPLAWRLLEIGGLAVAVDQRGGRLFIRQASPLRERIDCIAIDDIKVRAILDHRLLGLAFARSVEIQTAEASFRLHYLAQPEQLLRDLER